MDAERCKSILDNLIVTKTILDHGSGGSLHSVSLVTPEGANNFGIIILPDGSEETDKYLDALEYVRVNVVDRNLSPCFLRLDAILPCVSSNQELLSKSPEISGEHRIYAATNKVDSTLEDVSYQLTYYEFKCILFELLYAIRVAGNAIGEITTESIGITTVDAARRYRIDGIEFIITTPYIPILIELQAGGPANQHLVKDLIESMSKYAAVNMDLSERFSNELVAIIQGTDPFSNGFFKDLLSTSSLNRRSLKQTKRSIVDF